MNVLQQALKALEDWKTYMPGHWDVIDEQAITGLRQAIAEFDSHTLYREGYVNGYAFGEAAGKQQAKRDWVGLTNEERQEIAFELPIDAVRITEAKLKEKNEY